MEWMEFALSVLAGLAAAIPLVIKLIEYVKRAVMEKNWNALLHLIMSYMEEAERKFDDGATRKEWVVAMVEKSADIVNYDVDPELIGRLIDSLCDMTKVVNPPNGNVVGEALGEAADGVADEVTAGV